MTQCPTFSLEETQEALYDLLVRVDDFLSREGLRYSLYGGTLLGAVRHGGFIPWDDDLDLCMPRPDYDRLMKVAERLPDGLELVNWGNSALRVPFSKIWDRDIRAQEDAYSGKMEEFLWVDILPVDGIPTDGGARLSHYRRLRRLMMRHLWLLTDPRDSKTFLKRVVKMIYRGLDPSQKVLREESLIDRTAARYPYVESESVACYVGGAAFPWAVSREDFERTVDLLFCGRSFPAMSCYASYLAQVYGDYLHLPPESERQAHGVRVWIEGDGPANVSGPRRTPNQEGDL